MVGKILLQESIRFITRTLFIQCDLFLEDENNYIANYTDDTTRYFVGTTTAEV